MKFQLFGTLTLTHNDQALTEEELHSKKLIQLLTYLIIYRDEELPQQRLIEIFCDTSAKGPVDTLKNLIYRLRTALKPLGDEEFICTLSGAYRWNPEIPIETDYEALCGILDRTKEMPANEERRILCREALIRYREDFSRRLVGEAWFDEVSADYLKVRMELVKMLCRSEELEENWKGLQGTCDSALELDALDEDLHCWMIRSLSEQNKYEEAIRHYETAKRLIYEATGEQNPQKLHHAYTDVVSDIGRYIRNIGTVLIEAAEAEKPHGAYRCEYSTFRQIYQVEARKSTRIQYPDGVSEHILLLSVVNKYSLEEQNTTKEQDLEVMDILGRTIQNSLRVGDVFAKCSQNQYIVLLGPCTFANSEMIAGRIRKNFNKNIQKRPYQLLYDIDALTTFDAQQMKKLPEE